MIKMKYDTFFTNSFVASGTQTSNSILLTKSVFDLKSIYAVFRQTDKISSIEYDSCKSLPLGQILKSYQWRVGSQQMPSKPVTDITTAFIENSKAWNTFQNALYPSVSLDDYSNDAGVIGVNVEKDVSSELTGQSTNNGATVNFNYSIQAPTNYWSANGTNNAIPQHTITIYQLFTRVLTPKSDGIATLEE